MIAKFWQYIQLTLIFRFVFGPMAFTGLDGGFASASLFVIQQQCVVKQIWVANILIQNQCVQCYCVSSEISICALVPTFFNFCIGAGGTVTGLPIGPTTVTPTPIGSTTVTPIPITTPAPTTVLPGLIPATFTPG